MKLKVVLLIAVASTLSACHFDKSKPNFELIQDMLVSQSLKPQKYDETAPNNSAMRVPPEHTQPVGFTPYKYAEDIDGAAKNPNPLAGRMDEDTLKVGLKFYDTQCALCHGFKGEGGHEMSIGKLMPLKPPAVTTAKINGWTDGQIYHVITMGQGVMGAYASHIPQKYRWQVVNYIRYLQKVDQKDKSIQSESK